MVYNIGLESGAVFCGRACNAYLITGDKNIIIDTVPSEFKRQFIKAIEKYVPVSEIHGVFLLSVLPHRSGALDALFELNSDITVYATAAGLRNLSEITDFEFTSVLCKNASEIKVGDREFVSYITPNLTSPDTMLIFDKKSCALFSGELFSGFGELRPYFEEQLCGFALYIKPALEIVSSMNPAVVYPLHGVCDNVSDAVNLYTDLLKDELDEEFVAIAYSSKTGNNKSMAFFADKELAAKGIKTKVFCLDSEAECMECIKTLYHCNGFVLCVATENRTMPEPVWKFLSSVDVNAVSGKPYLAAGSYGWSSEGVYMANEILSMLKMRKVFKFTECIFTPGKEDEQNLREGLEALVDFILKQKEKSRNA